MVFLETKSLKENMVLGREIQKGDVLLERGTLLTAPLIEDLRKSGIPGVDVDRLPERIVREKRHPLADLQIGMELTRHVTDMSGRILYRRGTCLNEDDLQELKRWMIKTVWVKEEIFTRAGAMAAQSRDRLQDARKRGVLVYRSQLADDPPTIRMIALGCGMISLVLAQGGVPLNMAALLSGLLLMIVFGFFLVLGARPPDVRTKAPEAQAATGPDRTHVCPHCGVTMRIPQVRCHACGEDVPLAPEHAVVPVPLPVPEQPEPAAPPA